MPGTPESRPRRAATVVLSRPSNRRVTIRAQLFGQDHGKCRHDALTHLGLTKNQRDVIVRSDPDPGVEGVSNLLFLVLRLISKGARREMEADDQGHTASSPALQKITTVYNGRIRHGTPQRVTLSVRLRQIKRLISPCPPAWTRRDGWPCGCAGRCRSGRCCRSWPRRCRCRWGWVSWKAAPLRT